MIDALKSENLNAIQNFPKADLHNHFVLGGNRVFILSKTGYEILPISAPLKSMSEMDAWSSQYIGNRFNSPEGRRLLLEAAFEQAKKDGVTILEIGEDVWGHREFYSIDLYGDELAQPIENFIPIYDKAAENGLVLKAHVGEWGTARDIVTAVEKLHLSEVQHGIAAVQDDDVIDFLIF